MALYETKALPCIGSSEAVAPRAEQSATLKNIGNWIEICITKPEQNYCNQFHRLYWFCNKREIKNIDATISRHMSLNTFVDNMVLKTMNVVKCAISPRIWARVVVVFCFVVAISWVNNRIMWFSYPYPSGLLHWHRGNDCPSASEITLKDKAVSNQK